MGKLSDVSKFIAGGCSTPRASKIECGDYFVKKGTKSVFVATKDRSKRWLLVNVETGSTFGNKDYIGDNPTLARITSDADKLERLSA